MQAVVGDVADTEPGRGRNPAVGDVDPVEQHLTGGNRPLAGDDLAQLLLAVAVDPRDPEDLAAVQLEREIMQRGDAAISQGRDAAQREHGAAALLAAGQTRLRRLGATEHLLDDALAHALPVRAGHDVRSQVTGVAATSQDGDPVTDRQCLAELVGDEHHGDALVAQAAQEIEQRRHLARGEHGRRLVEEEDPGAPEEHLDDLDALALAQGQMPDLGVGRDVEPEVGEQRRHPAFRGAEIDQEPTLGAEHHVLQDGEIRHEGEVLIDGADAAMERVCR